MRLKIGDHDVEGSPDEVARLLKLLGREAPVEGRRQPAAEADAQLEGASPFLTEEVALEVLTRRPLADAYKTMFRKLDAAGTAWTTARELQEALGFSTREFAGLLGAFGRRISHTPGGTRFFFDQYWDDENGYNLYRLPPSVRSALRKAKIV